MDDKVSRYNIETEYDKGILLYNALTNQLLPMSFNDYAAIETLLENLPTFKNRFPDLYSAFQKSGFIVEYDFEELSYIKLQNKRRIFMDRNYHLTINPTFDCNLKCWYCSVNYAGAKHDKKGMSDYANVNSPFLDNIKRNTLINIINKEMITNTAWREIRDTTPCNNCLYQYICPSPSNYEITIGRNNLCNIK